MGPRGGVDEIQDSPAGVTHPKRLSAFVNGERASIAPVRWPEWTALSLYAAIVVFAISYHEPWADEAQAWQLARSLSLPALFQTYIRYEASPGLWHFLLWILVHAHVSYSGLHWICGVIAFGATALVVFKSPFPRYLKLTLPFTFFLLFQYAVVARSYVLVPPLLYLAALWWKKSPTILALQLGLLANVSLHAAVISGGLAVVYFLKESRRGAHDARKYRKLLQPALVLAGLYFIAIWTAWPPHDLLTHISDTRGEHSSSFLLKFVMALVMGICRPWLLAIPFWIVIACWLKERNSLIYLLPVLFFALFSGVVSVGWWHAGQLIPLLICVLWITWPSQRETMSRRVAAGQIGLIAVAGLQISWAAYAIQYDYRGAYSADLAASKFLRPLVQRGMTIALTSLYDPYCDAYRAVGILPYFDHNIFINLPNSFWSWSDQNPTEKLFDKALRAHPAVVVAEANTVREGIRYSLPFILQDSKTELLQRSGYRLTNVFCGALPAPAEYRPMEKTCHLIYQPAGSADVSSAKEARALTTNR